MALELILKNIRSFLEVLYNARRPIVSSWNAETVHKAYQWAAYCQQIYRQADGKPYRESLDAEIQKINEYYRSLNENPYLVNLVMLSQSSVLLTKELLLNNYSKSDLWMLVLNQCGFTYNKLFPEILPDPARQFFSTAACAEMVSFLTGILNTTGSGRQPARSVESSRESIISGRLAMVLCSCQSEMLLQRLDNAMSPDNVFASADFFSFSTTQHGLLLITMALIVLSSYSSDKWKNNYVIRKRLQEHIFTAVTERPEFLWKLQPLLLCRLCMDYEYVLAAYLHFLTRCGERLTMEYSSAVDIQSYRDMVSWKSDSQTMESMSLDYLQLVERFYFLNTHGSTRVVAATRETLKNLVEQYGEISVWTSVVKEIGIYLL